MSKYTANMREKITARIAVRDAIARGELVRPKACGRCGKEPAPAKDGRATIQAHHDDYSKPLDIEWICVSCHRIETVFPVVFGCPALGAKNGRALLSEAQVLAIRSAPETSKALARVYGVGATTIRDIRKGRTWTHLK